jgi:hypothetical protein
MLRLARLVEIVSRDTNVLVVLDGLRDWIAWYKFVGMEDSSVDISLNFSIFNDNAVIVIQYGNGNNSMLMVISGQVQSNFFFFFKNG